ncbi:hypothetical protein KO561_01205 [Radiobacillus kanasensis]|uniref:hypothetical protein n=1 Tax=Radiobacillus kanasensis TaxID=2844358 RepID=UPI001E3E07E8|nr:hypothetical protein [Radiobacillus kanasensis]UFT99623.1 hypothetical protein KO561_01205 [Radiobacillus kanasensis]
MEEFFAGLTPDEQVRYKKLAMQFNSATDIDEKKKYIPHLVLLEEKGKLEMEKKKKRSLH